MSASQNVLSVEINNIQKEIKNPYKDMKDWLEEEKLDIDAMLEALQSLDELVKKFEACCDNNESVSKNIQSIQYGGRYNKVMQFFRKSENNLEEEKKNNERYIAILYEIIKLASFNMEFYLKNFKEEKIKDYYKTLKTFILDSNNNLQQNKQLWDTISKELEQKVQVNRKESNDSNNIIN